MTGNQMKIKLPRFISDGMVIQRNAQVKIWGWAQAGEAITVYFIEKVCRAIADEEGKWQVSIRTENAGGPYDMLIEIGEGTESITIKNILLGDVWLCSGQSNMGMAMLSVRDKYPEEVASACNDSIRQFLVPIRYDFEKPQTDFESGSWEVTNPQSILNFTAAGYFFAVKLFEKYQIPIGLINSSLGGASAEAFMSEDALLPFTEYYEKAQMLKDRNYQEALEKEDQVTSEEWHRSIDENDMGIPEGGKPFYDADYDASAWPYTKVPCYMEEEGVGDFNGVVWFRKEIEIPSSLLHNPARIFMGNIIDEDSTYINGIKIGSILSQYASRKYDIPESLLKEGKNTIMIRVVNTSGKGGFYKGKPYHIQIGDQTMDLSGEWQYMIGAKSEPMRAPNFVMWCPSGLYNAMIAPMIGYAIKGVIWYQGESNTKKSGVYESLFKELIADWRRKWNLGDFPFLYVQLPNYMEASDSPAESSWAELREAQRKTLALSGTGMIVAIDLGEWNDIHPVNKKDVGNRLALAARKVAYGDKTVVASGPMFQFAKKDGNRIILSFSDTGSGLVTKGGDRPGHFAIAGADKIFVWADVKIENDCVAVWHNQVTYPVHVRYAWADNPEGANLYNREGLPASPFTTE